MAFTKAPRLGIDTRKYPDVVPISDEMAKYAKGTAPSKADEQHDQAMERAKKIDEDVEPIVGEKSKPALYKIEVYFGPNRTLRGPNACTVKFWESGRRLHGGGDDLMYMCKNIHDLSQGCGRIFSSDFVRGAHAICPGCNKAVVAGNCVRQLVFRDETQAGGTDYRVETRKLAALLAKYWRKLDCNADVYCKFDKTDIRYQMMEKEYGVKKARELKGLSIYPLKNILSDTAGGASLEDRIFTYLTA